MDAAFLNQPSYLYAIEVQNRGGGGEGGINSLLPLVFSALFKS